MAPTIYDYYGRNQLNNQIMLFELVITWMKKIARGEAEC